MSKPTEEMQAYIDSLSAADTQTLIVGALVSVENNDSIAAVLEWARAEDALGELQQAVDSAVEQADAADDDGDDGDDEVVDET